MSLRDAIPVVTACLVLTGCGTTVAPSAVDAVNGGSTSRSGLGAVTSSGLAGGPGPVAGSAVGSATSGPGVPVGAGPRVAGTVSSATTDIASVSGGPAAAPNAPIRLGVVVADPGKVLAAFGQPGVSDIFAPYKAEISYMNAHGGIAGHKVVPSYISVDGSAQDGDTAAQAACTSAVQDDHVNIVVSGGNLLDTYLSCLQRAGVSSFDSTPWVADNAFLAQHPNLFAPDAISVDRYARALIQVSVARGILKKGDVLGVITEDCPWGPRVYNNVVVPLAKSYGVTTDTATFSCIKTLSGQEIADASRASQEAALKFRTDGVTHVMALTAAEGYLIDTFSANASQQQYHPKYMVTSNAFPYNNSRTDSPVHFAADAEPNMSGIGFLPFLDLGEAAKPATPAQAAQQAKCRAMDPNMGFSKQYSHDYDHWTQVNGFYALCDQLQALARTLEADGVRYDIASLAAGYQRVEQGFVSADDSVGSLAPYTSRRDGVGQTLGFSWDPAAQAFRYTGQRYTMP